MLRVQQVYNAPDVDNAYSKLECVVAGYVEKHAPIIQKKVRGLYCPWRTEDLLALIRQEVTI